MMQTPNTEHQTRISLRLTRFGGSAEETNGPRLGDLETLKPRLHLCYNYAAAVFLRLPVFCFCISYRLPPACGLVTRHGAVVM